MRGTSAHQHLHFISTSRSPLQEVSLNHWLAGLKDLQSHPVLVLDYSKSLAAHSRYLTKVSSSLLEDYITFNRFFIKVCPICIIVNPHSISICQSLIFPMLPIYHALAVQYTTIPTLCHHCQDVGGSSCARGSGVKFCQCITRSLLLYHAQPFIIVDLAGITSDVQAM